MPSRSVVCEVCKKASNEVKKIGLRYVCDRFMNTYDRVRLIVSADMDRERLGT